MSAGKNRLLDNLFYHVGKVFLSFGRPFEIGSVQASGARTTSNQRNLSGVTDVYTVVLSHVFIRLISWAGDWHVGDCIREDDKTFVRHGFEKIWLER